VPFTGALSVIGYRAVLIEQKQPQLSGIAQLCGADADRDAHQVDLELRGGDGVDPGRQVVDGVADDGDVFAGDQPGGLGGGDGGPQRCQRLAGQAGAGGQLGGLV
jgi:hypothetical protein